MLFRAMGLADVGYEYLQLGFGLIESGHCYAMHLCERACTIIQGAQAGRV